MLNVFTSQNRWLLFVSIATASALPGCNDSDGIFGNTGDSAAVGTKNLLNVGPFDGCISATPLDTSQIYVTFSIPAGADKMNVYRNGSIAYSSSNAADNSFIDVGLIEGASYTYTCEATASTNSKMGAKQFTVSTLITHAPIFNGITKATIIPTPSTPTHPNGVFVQWDPASANGTAAATSYEVFAVPSNNFNWSNYPTSASLPTPKQVVLANTGKLNATLSDLGDQVHYTIFVRACAANNLCDVNQITKSITMPDDGLAPKTLGATAVAIDRIHNTITLNVPWDDSLGAIAKRNIYYLAANSGTLASVPAASQILLPQQLLRTDVIADPSAVPSQIQISGLPDNKVYHFIVQDQEPGPQNDGQGLMSSNNHIVSVDVGDMTAPLFSGILALDYGDTNGQNTETSLTASWYAINPENQNSAGATTYAVYLSNGSVDPCDVGVAQSPEVDALYTSSHTAIHAGDTVKSVITGLSARTTYRVCVKAKDAAGNASILLPSVYREATTRDTTPPIFGGINTFDPAALTLSWNPSTSADIATYKVTAYLTPSGGSENPIPYVLTKTSAAAPGGFTLSSADSIPYKDNDSLRLIVDACDNAADTGFAPPSANHNNCTSTTRTISATIPDTTAPKNFQGIDPSGLQCTDKDGEVLVKWLPPSTGDWTDYAGFRIYTVDSSGNLEQPPRAIIDCPSQTCSSSSPTLSGVVSGLLPHKTYKFYVTAYDKAVPPNVISIAALDIAGHSASFQTCDYTVPNFSSGLSLTNISGGARLNWLSAADNQYALEGSVSYQLYRKITSPFNSGDFAGAAKTCAYIKANPSSNPVVVTSQTPASCYTNIQNEKEYQLLANSSQLTYDDLQSNPVSGPKEGTTYSYLVCATDAVGNTLCDGNKVIPFTVGDITPPALSLPSKAWFLSRDLSARTWDISWSMADNVTTSNNLSVIVKKTMTANCTLFPSWSAVSPYKSGAGIVSMLAETGPDASEGCIQYQVSACDQAVPTPNCTSDTLSVPFDNKGPTAASALVWNHPGSTATLPLIAQWNPSTDIALTSQTVSVFSNTDCTGTGLIGSYPYSSGATSHTIASNLTPSGSSYSFNVSSMDNHGNSVVSACSNPTLVDADPYQFTSTVTVPPSLAANGTATATITVTVNNKGGAPLPNKVISVVTSRGAPHDTIVAINATTNASGIATFTVKSSEAGNNVQIIATDVTDSNLVLNSKPFISFTSFPTSIVTSVSTSTLLADNTTTTTVGFTFKDVNTNVVSGKAINLTSDRATDIISVVPSYCSGAMCVTDSNGHIDFLVKSINVGQANLTVFDTTDSITFPGPSVNFISGPAVTLEFSNPPTTTLAGQPIKNASNGSVNIVMKDQWGHIASYFNDQKSITMTLINGNGATLNGTTVKQSNAGIANFSDLSINPKASGYRLQAALSATPTISVTSSSFDINPGVPSRLKFLNSPITTKASLPLATGDSSNPFVKIAVVDSADNIVDTVSGLTISISLLTNTAQKIYCGRDMSNVPLDCASTPLTVVNGVASLSSVFILKALTGYSITATSSPTAYPLLATPSAFDVVVNTPHHVLISGISNKWGDGQCSTVATLGVLDVAENPSPVVNGDSYISTCIDTQPGLCMNINSSNASLSAYSDSSCTAPIQQIRVPIGSSSASFYYKSTGVTPPATITLTLADASSVVAGTIAGINIAGIAVFDYQGAGTTYSTVWTAPVAPGSNVRVHVWGAGGGGGYCSYGGYVAVKGGNGAYISDTLTVPADGKFKITIGRGGVAKSASLYWPSFGGALTSIQQNSDSTYLVIAGAGGGGGGYNYGGDNNGQPGGNGGWPNGDAAFSIDGPGQGGTQSSGGAIGTGGYGLTFAGTAGSYLTGGIGKIFNGYTNQIEGGGGGAGYYGGGGGGASASKTSMAAGGGGSSYSKGRTSPGSPPSAYGVAGVDATSGLDAGVYKGGTGNEFYRNGIGIGGTGSTTPATNNGGHGRIVIEY